MRQVANSLLTLHPFSSEARPSVRMLPRDGVRMEGPLLNPFFKNREGFSSSASALLGFSKSPRISIYPRLGEGSIRNLLQSLPFFLAVVIVFLAPIPVQSMAGDTPGKTQSSQPVDSEQIIKVLKAHIAATTVFKVPEIEVRLSTYLKDIELPPGKISYRISHAFVPWSYRSLQLPVEAVQDGKTIRTFFVSATVVIRAEVLLAARDISFGHEISSEDLKIAISEITNPKLGYLRNGQQVLGKTARRVLSLGSPVTQDDLTNPVLVRNGDMVRLRLERGVIRLATVARAEQNGQLGQFIRVRNPDFSQAVKARVAARGEVIVE